MDSKSALVGGRGYVTSLEVVPYMAPTWLLWVSLCFVEGAKSFSSREVLSTNLRAAWWLPYMLVEQKLLIWCYALYQTLGTHKFGINDTQDLPQKHSNHYQLFCGSMILRPMGFKIPEPTQFWGCFSEASNFAFGTWNWHLVICF